MRFPRFFTRHSEFIGHVATLMSGKAIAGLIALATMPIVSRLFTPSDFGVAAVFVAIMSMTAHVASFKYDAAIILPKDPKDAIKLMALAYRIVFAVCILILLLLFLYEGTPAKVPALELLGGLKWGLPLGVLLMGAIHIQECWLTRTRQFKLSSASLVVGNATTGATRIGLGVVLGSTAGGLIGGHIFGMALRLVVQKSASREGIRALIGPASWSDMKETARAYADFPKFNAPAALLFAIGQKLPVLLFGVMFSPAVAGFYSMAYQLVKAPVTMVSNSARRVFNQKAASIRNQRRSLQKAFLLTSGGLALAGAPAFVLIWFFGQPLATWFLGAQWAVAGRYLQIIAPWIFMIWVMAPCNPIYVVLREQRLWLFLQVVLTLLRIGVFGFAHLLTAGPEWTLQAYVLVTVVGNLITWATALILIRKANIGPPTAREEPDRARPHGTRDMTI